MARLPTPGSDAGTWGDVLNQFLQVGHDTSGRNIGGKIPETLKSGNYTIAAADEGSRLVATGAITFSVPAVGTLGNGFECELVNDSSGSVTIDGPGGTNVTLASGEIASLLETNSKQRIVKGASTIIS